MNRSVSLSPEVRNLAAVPALPVLRPAAAAAVEVEPAELIHRWLASLSDGCRRTYARSLRRFAAWAIDGDAEPTDALRLLCGLGAAKAAELARRWRTDDLESSGLASGSVAVYVASLASLVSAARRAGVCDFKLEAVLPKVEPRQDRSGPRRGETERLVATIDDRAATGNRWAVRDALTIRLLYVCGLRRAEACSLRLEDIDEAGGVLRVRRKGRKEKRAVLASPKTMEALARWLDVRGRQPGYVLVGKGQDGSQPMAGESVRSLLLRWAKAAGVKHPCRPHGMRHAAASEIARRGSLAELLAFGQWTSLTAARRYLDDRQEDRVAALRLVDL